MKRAGSLLIYFKSLLRKMNYLITLSFLLSSEFLCVLTFHIGNTRDDVNRPRPWSWLKIKKCRFPSILVQSICSEDYDFMAKSKEMALLFKTRRYPHGLLSLPPAENPKTQGIRKSRKFFSRTSVSWPMTSLQRTYLTASPCVPIGGIRASEISWFTAPSVLELILP